MNFTDGIFYVIILIMSVVIHEVAHGYVAYRLGDETARLQGRLTLNPLAHLDIFGSILLPLFLIISHAGFVVGWAKPVPYNPNNLRKGKYSEVFVAIAGIVANLAIAVIFGILIRIMIISGISFGDAYTMSAFYKIASTVVIVNIVLALFNLIPIPPLDGSKILFGLFPNSLREISAFMDKWGVYILIFFIIFIWKYLSPLIYLLFTFLTGLA
jgi:Zn-dependent protease